MEGEMMRIYKQAVMQVAVGAVALFLPMLSIQGVSQSTAESKTQANKKVAVHAGQQHQDEGARIFEQNCARCHNAPDGFSPRIAGTIVRHMRVRASLSKHDEEELLRFFNP
jgi:cytochrome c5